MGEVVKRNPDFSVYVDRAFFKGVRDGVLATIGLTGLSVLGHRYSSFYRGFSFPGKAFFVMMGGMAITIISAEHEMVNTYYRIKQSQSMYQHPPAPEETLNASNFVTKYQFPISGMWRSHKYILEFL